MMKALFVYSNKYEVCDGKYYSITQTAEVWEKRYLNIFDSLTVIGRFIDVDRVVGKKLSSAKNVTFARIPYGLNPNDYFLKYREIYKFILNEVEKVDFIIARQSYFGAVAASCAKKLGKPYVVEVVGSSWDSNWNYSFKGKIVAPFFQLQAKKMIKNASNVIYVTKEYLQKEYPTQARTIGISNVEIDDPDEEVLKNRIERILQTNPTTLNLCTVAAVDVKYKGQAYVIKAMSLLKEKGLTFTYYVIGGGDQARLKDYSEKLGLKDNVVFTGPLEHEKVFEYLDKSDIYLQPSLQEGLPRALIEAMSRGLPAIGFKTAGIPELLEKQFVCRRKSVSDICRCLELLSDKHNRKIQAERNFNEAAGYRFSLLNKLREDFIRSSINNCRKS
jgi:glycosyltransferase involved in cell wall biosynthesis